MKPFPSLKNGLRTLKVLDNYPFKWMRPLKMDFIIEKNDFRKQIIEIAGVA